MSPLLKAILKLCTTNHLFTNFELLLHKRVQFHRISLHKSHCTIYKINVTVFKQFSKEVRTKLSSFLRRKNFCWPLTPGYNNIIEPALNAHQHILTTNFKLTMMPFCSSLTTLFLFSNAMQITCKTKSNVLHEFTTRRIFTEIQRYLSISFFSLF